eukprot:CAMPEP_0119512546 /NCGR_PEP_ID=MMETSP1344-20130328/30894_1 /TAXON_ID=236787 /ORGANISM="Florenciella parvula, Strain CCMP2471" /LENGTH=31 /DNA_ID= /DNA_START= /DNA_END= /DNA_ORIENTATION=
MAMQVAAEAAYENRRCSLSALRGAARLTRGS